MKIHHHHNFNKAYAKLDTGLQEKVDAALEVFHANPKDPALDNHALRGDLEGKRAIRVAWNLRVVFEEHDDYAEVMLVDVGSHNQVY
jgi:addiction module RelE/StbE family toxin